MQVDVGVLRRRAAQHGPDEARLELLEQSHRAQRRVRRCSQQLAVLGPGEQSLMLGERLLDLAVARQRGAIVDPRRSAALRLAMR
jgi:hypothetical protein